MWPFPYNDELKELDERDAPTLSTEEDKVN